MTRSILELFGLAFLFSSHILHTHFLSIRLLLSLHYATPPSAQPVIIHVTLAFHHVTVASMLLIPQQGEGNNISNCGTVCKHHDKAIDAYAHACCGWHAAL